MRRGFVRVLFGSNRRCLDKIRKEVQLVSKEPIQVHPTKVFCWGLQNHQVATDAGWDAILMSDEPHAYPMGKIFNDDGKRLEFVDDKACGSFWRHKLLALEKATEFFDEFILLDWDIIPLHPLPTYFWDRFQARAAIQGMLFVYHRRQLNWKEVDQRKTMSASFIYIRDPSIPKQLLQISEDNPGWREEIVLIFFCDMVLGNMPHTNDQFHNAQAFTDNHEIWCCEFSQGMYSKLPRPMVKEPIFEMISTIRRYPEAFR